MQILDALDQLDMGAAGLIVEIVELAASKIDRDVSETELAFLIIDRGRSAQ
jgi:hypothetical protein